MGNMLFNKKETLRYVIALTTFLLIISLVLVGIDNDINKNRKDTTITSGEGQEFIISDDSEEIAAKNNLSLNSSSETDDSDETSTNKEAALYNAIMAIIDEKIEEKEKNISIGQKIVEDIENDKILSITIRDNVISALYEDNTKIEIPRNESNKYMSIIKTTAIENNVEIISIANKTSIVNSSIFITFNIVLLALLIFSGMKLYTMNKREVVYTPRKVVQPKEKSKEGVPDVNFDNLQGCQELKKNVQEIISYLKNPEKLVDIGARMPKGIVLYGPPGTGKTLTAKAIAGTAGVPFISASGSDFVEMYVGVGAKRVRDLYAKAREKAPCIVFIDEIDAVGAKRGDTNNGERDQTINALLTELDGFAGSEGILTICATNRLDMLDPALIRSGRFDLHLAVPLPDKTDRLSILKIHARDKKIAEDVDFNLLAAKTIGFSGADLETLLNESALTAVSKNKDFIDNDDIDRAFFKIVMKGDRKENISLRDKEELNIVAYHEAGHALISKLICNEEVPMVTIISSTSGAGGVTFRNPKETSLFSKKHLRNLIKVAYGGRAAEQIYYGNDEDITTGASNDIKQATEMIYNYICTYGMGNEGMINMDMIARAGVLPDKTIDNMIELSNTIYEETLSFLRNNKPLLVEVANELLKRETLNDEDINIIIQKHNIVL